MRVAIFVDSKFRDTFQAVLLEKELRKRDRSGSLETLVVSFDLWDHVGQLFRPDVVILNHGLGHRNREIIKNARYSIVVPTEGRPNTDEQASWFVSGQDGAVDLYLSWNRDVARMFEHTEALVVGCPRFDLYHDYEHLINTQQTARAKLGIPPGPAPVIGIFTSFPQAKFSQSGVAFNAADWEDLGVTRISTRQDPLQFARDETEERRKFLSWMGVIRSLPRLSNAKLVLKPHPMEDVLYLQRWAHENGATFVSQDNIANVIAACDLIINRRGCITTLEALLMGKPVLQVGHPEAKGPAAAARGVTDLGQFILGLNTDDSSLTLNPGTPEANDYLSVCGVDQPGATARAARAIMERIKHLPETRHAISGGDRLNLQKLMIQYSRANVLPHPEVVPVGKRPTSNYIDAWRAKLD